MPRIKPEPAFIVSDEPSSYSNLARVSPPEARPA